MGHHRREIRDRGPQKGHLSRMLFGSETTDGRPQTKTANGRFQPQLPISKLGKHSLGDHRWETTDRDHKWEIAAPASDFEARQALTGRPQMGDATHPCECAL